MLYQLSYQANDLGAGHFVRNILVEIFLRLNFTTAYVLCITAMIKSSILTSCHSPQIKYMKFYIFICALKMWDSCKLSAISTALDFITVHRCHENSVKYLDLGQPKSVAPWPGCSAPD